jgi:protein involved in polysaccharide export with SLBB domain
LTTAEAAKRVLDAYHDQNLVLERKPSIELVTASNETSLRAGPAAKGETFAVQVWGLDGPVTGPEHQVRVDEQGRIRLPLIGDMDVLGKTEFDIAEEAERAYREKKLIDAPLVSLVRVKSSDQSTSPATAPAR